MGGIIFKQANQPGGASGITGATNGLHVVGSNVELGGALTEIVTDITADTSQGIRLIPALATYEGALLTVGPVNNIYGNAYLNLIGDQTGPFQTIPLFISDHSAGVAEGFGFYYDTVNNAMQISAVNSTASVNVPNANVIVGSQLDNGGSRFQIASDPTSLDQISLIDSTTGGAVQANYTDNTQIFSMTNFQNALICSIDGNLHTSGDQNDYLCIDNGGNVVIGTLNNFGNARLESISDGTIPQFSIDLEDGSNRMEMFINHEIDHFQCLLLPFNTTTRFVFGGDGGLQFPQVTEAVRLAIVSPGRGLTVYQTDATEGLYAYKSTGWTFII